MKAFTFVLFLLTILKRFGNIILCLGEVSPPEPLKTFEKIF